MFHVTNTVSYDTTVAAFAEGGTSPFSLNRKAFDAEVSLTPLKYTAFRAGYTREQVDQTFRFFDTTTENTLRVSADTSGLSWLMLRAVYEHAKRTGSGFDEQALDDIGEQVSLRQFDISDRTANRVSLVTQVTPVSSFSVNGSVSAGNEDRPGTGFGLRSNDNRSYRNRRGLRAARRRFRWARRTHGRNTRRCRRRGRRILARSSTIRRATGRPTAPIRAQTFVGVDGSAQAAAPKTDVRLVVHLQPRRVALRLRPRAEHDAPAGPAAAAGRQRAAARDGGGALPPDARTSAPASSTGTTSTPSTTSPWARRR